MFPSLRGSRARGRTSNKQSCQMLLHAGMCPCQWDSRSQFHIASSPGYHVKMQVMQPHGEGRHGLGHIAGIQRDHSRLRT